MRRAALAARQGHDGITNSGEQLKNLLLAVPQFFNKICDMFDDVAFLDTQ